VFFEAQCIEDNEERMATKTKIRRKQNGKKENNMAKKRMTKRKWKRRRRR
jgi:hypothetical protein